MYTPVMCFRRGQRSIVEFCQNIAKAGLNLNIRCSKGMCAQYLNLRQYRASLISIRTCCMKPTIWCHVYMLLLWAYRLQIPCPCGSPCLQDSRGFFSILKFGVEYMYVCMYVCMYTLTCFVRLFSAV